MARLRRAAFDASAHRGRLFAHAEPGRPVDTDVLCRRSAVGGLPSISILSSGRGGPARENQRGALRRPAPNDATESAVHPALRLGYEGFARLARIGTSVARLLPDIDAKAMRALRARAGIRGRYRAWGMARRAPAKRLLWMHA